MLYCNTHYCISFHVKGGLLSTNIGPNLNNSPDQTHARILPGFVAPENNPPHQENISEEHGLSSIDDVMKKLMTAANGFGIFATGASALSRAVNYQASKDKETFFDKLAGFAVKGSMGINSAFNVYNGIRKKSIFDTAGFLGELVIASAAPYKFVNLLRGLTFCLYQTPEFLTSTLVGGKLPKSASWEDNLKIISERLPKAFSQLFKAETYKPEMLSKSAGLITGMWGGIISLLGVGFWGLTGNSSIGGAIKGVGEGLVDLFQVIPKEHWESKKTNYIRSGFSFIAGTAADIASRLMGNEPLLRDICFFFVGIGRWFMSLSKAAGESNYGPGGAIKPASKEKIQFNPRDLALTQAV